MSTQSRIRQALRSRRSTRTVDAVRRLQQSHHDILQREDRAWRHAWQHLDSDLESLDDNYAVSVGLAEEQLRSHHARQAARMMRRREVAAAQIDGGQNAFDQPLAWMAPTSRPRTFPHPQQPITEEEQSAWRMFDLAEEIEKSPRKQSRRSSRELTRSPVSDDEKPRRKRPRTRRDSQLLGGNNRNGDSSSIGSTILGAEDLGDIGSTASGSYLGSILESIAKSAEAPPLDPPPAELFGIRLSRIQPISPEPSNVASPRGRPISPVFVSSISPTPAPRSRPHSPVAIGQIHVYPSSSIRRTPFVSHIRPSLATASESSPSSPPASGINSPKEMQRHHPCTSSDRDEPGSYADRAGESSSSDSNTRSYKRGRCLRYRSQEEGGHSALSTQDKADIAKIVRSALKPLYPQKLSENDFTKINKRVSRKLYQLVEAETGGDVLGKKEKWIQVVQEEVMNAVECL